LSTVNAVVTTSAPAGASGPTVPTTFSYTGQPQTWGPTTSQETIEILAVGAAGGSDFYGGSSSTGGNTPGGYGGAEVATLTVPANTTLSITVGGLGGSAAYPYGGAGGYGGGANGELGVIGGGPGGAGGGGGSTVANGSTTLVVAGGGGGAGATDCVMSGTSCVSGSGQGFPDLGGAGGSGGGSAGGAGYPGQSTSVAGGGGGGGGNTTTATGGAAGSSTCSGTGSGGSGSGGGGGGGCYYSSAAGGGGGGGYFGGGGGGGGGKFFTAPSPGGGGGGGSSYAASGSTNVQSENGAQSANGYVEIGLPGTLNLPLIGGAVTAAEGQGDGPPSECGCVASTPVHDPVNAMDGDFSQSTTDLSVAGPGVALAFVRTYDADLAQNSGGVTNPSDLGPGWTDNLSMNISPLAGAATVTEADGAQVLFVASSGAGSPYPWCSSSFNYCAIAPRDIATLNQNTNGTWTFTNAMSSPLTYTFSSSGALTSVANAAGQSISASSESPGTGACPSGATACTLWTSNATTPNKTLTLAFTSGELTQVFGYASSGTPSSVSFCYYGQACAPGSGGLSGSLYSATEPGSLTTTYAYDATNSSTSLQYDLLTQTNPDTSTLTNVYNSSGQISQQTSPAGVLSTFSYSEVANQPVGAVPGDSTTVTVTPGTGLPSQVTQYNFASGELASTTLDPSAPTPATTSVVDDPTTGQNQTSTDPNGNITSTNLPTPSTPGSYLSAIDPSSKTDGVGNTTLYAFTSTNQVWCEVEAAEQANGVTCPSTQPTTAPTPGAKNTAALGATITYYDAAGNPTYVTDPLGNTTETAYTPAEQPFCSVDATEFTIAGKSCPANPPANPPTGTVTGYTTTLYNAAGDVSSVTNPNGATTTYGYTNAAFPDTATSVTDPQGDVTSITLDSAGRPTSKTVTSATSGFSATTVTAYDSAGRLFCTIAPLAYSQGHTTCPSTAPTSPPTPGTNPWPGAEITIFNGEGQVTDHVSPLGGVNLTAYDGAGNPYCTITPGNYANSVTCPAAGAAWVAGTSITQYDGFGRATQVTNPLGGITLTSYDTAGNTAQSTVESNNSTADPNVVTSYGYDADNRVTSTTVDPGGGTLQEKTEQSYDPDGNVFCTASAKAVTGANFQCPIWQPTWIASPPNPMSLYSSTPTSAQANDVTTNFYDPVSNEIQTTDPDIHTTVNAFDPAQRTYCTSDPTNVGSWLSGHPGATYPYLCPSAPPTSPPAQGSNPGYSTTIFDAAGNTSSSTDQAGDTTAYTYNAAGQKLTTSDPRIKVTTDCYYYQNGSGQCANGAPTNGGLSSDLYSTTTPATSADPSGEVTTTTYEPGGATLTVSTLATPTGNATDAYDAAGDLTSTTYSGVATGYVTPATVSRTYNADATVHTMTDASGTTTYSYDALGDVTSKALVATGGLSNATTNSTYFTTGTLASIVYPSYSGHTNPTVNYTYDADGAMATSLDWLGNTVSFGHDQDNNPTAQDNNVSTSNPSGTSNATTSFDNADSALGTATHSCTSLGTTTGSYTSATLNADGQVTQSPIENVQSCGGTASFLNKGYSYDVAGRVSWEGLGTQGANPANFAYDPSGDPSTLANNTAGTTDTFTQAFDGAGEVTSQTPIAGSGGSTTNYTHDTLGDQTAASGGVNSTSTYSAAAQLATATVGSTTATYTYDGTGLVAATSVQATGAPAWQSPANIDSTRTINATSCVSSSFCVAVDNGGYATIWNGINWSTPNHIDSTNSVTAISCISSSFCGAVDSAGDGLVYNGTSWSVSASLTAGHSLGAISCVSSSFCATVGSSGYATTYTGSWATASRVDSTNTIDAVSCTSSSFCQAVDAKGNAVAYTGSGWQSPAGIDGHNVLNVVGCTSSSFCVAADNKGNVVKYTGSWGTVLNADSTRNIDALSCVSSSFCVAADQSGFETTYNGSSWSSPTDIDAARSISALSCPSSSFCAAVDTSGYATTYNGSSWLTPTNVDSTRSFKSVSCASSSFCAAVDGSGYGALYKNTTSTTLSQLTWNSNAALPLVLSDGTNDYVYGPGTTPVEQVALSSSTPSYLVYDSAGRDWTTTNGAGNITGFWSYDAYGNLTQGAPTSPFGFDGQYMDATTGLVNDRARWYEPPVGGFTTRDPAFASTDTAYTYAGDDPVNRSDPTGDCVSTWFGCIGPGPANGISGTLGATWYDTGGKAVSAIGGLNWSGALHGAANGALQPLKAAGTELEDIAKGLAGIPLPPCSSLINKIGYYGADAFPYVLGLAAGIDSFGSGNPAEESSGAESDVPQVLANQAAGNAFRDATASQLQGDGWDIVGTEVRVSTPLGVRVTDILAERGGNLVGFETKLGSSPYLPSQVAKDVYISRFGGTLADGSTIRYPTVLVRGAG
jgi:RHS repeat-associated protein